MNIQIKEALGIIVPSILITVMVTLVIVHNTAASASSLEVTNEPVASAEAKSMEAQLPVKRVSTHLTASSSIDDILQKMRTAHLTYDSLHIVIEQHTDQGVERIYDSWLSQSSYSFHITIDHVGFQPETMISDGSFTSRYMPEAGKNVLIPISVGSEQIGDTQIVDGTPVHRLNWFTMSSPIVGQLVMPGEFAGVEFLLSDDIVIRGEEMLLGRPTIIVETMAHNLWVDAETGLILKDERVDGDWLQYILIVTELALDPDLDPTLFHLDHSTYDPDLLD